MGYRLVGLFGVLVWWLAACVPVDRGSLQQAKHRLEAYTSEQARAATTENSLASAQEKLLSGVSYPTHGQAFSSTDRPLWPDGKILYYIEGIVGDDYDTLMQGMTIWQQSTHNIIQFTPCHPTGASGLPTCPTKYLHIRYRTPQEIKDGYTSHSCTTGYVSSPQMRLNPNFGIAVSLTMHELGHCIGISHEHNRADNDRWLPQGPSLPSQPTERFPLVGNYAYDSVLHYTQFKIDDVTYKATDYFGNQLKWQPQLSAWDVSRAMQYYAYESNANWGMFMSLNGIPLSSSALPDPYLAVGSDGSKVSAVGSPAISRDQPGSFDLFVLGSDRQLYWKSIRQEQVATWRVLSLPALGRGAGQMGSEPAAISIRQGWIDVFAIDAQGRLVWCSYRDGAWGRWVVVGGGAPAEGLAQNPDGSYIGPAVASRSDGSFDVFVVQRDRRLATSHFGNGTWGGWQILGTRGQYAAAARPAALTLSRSRIQLAINSRTGSLYEPTVDFDASGAATFALGAIKAQMRADTPPGLARRDDAAHPYRVLIVDNDGHLAHRFSGASTWRKIGGVLREKTGPTAVAEGPYGAWIAIHGPDVTGCTQNCKDPTQAGQIIQPGGLWLRRFK